MKDDEINRDSSTATPTKRISSLAEQRQRLDAKLAAKGLVSTPPGTPGRPEMLSKTNTSLVIVFKKPESLVLIDDYEVQVLQSSIAKVEPAPLTYEQQRWQQAFLQTRNATELTPSEVSKEVQSRKRYYKFTERGVYFPVVSAI